jgi:predicted nucleotidyltransferase
MGEPSFFVDGELLENIHKVFNSFENIEQVKVFGSRAKGIAKPGSDFDLAIFGNNISVTDLLELYQQFDNLDLPYRFDLVIYNQIENEAVRKHIDRVGKQIFKR